MIKPGALNYLSVHFIPLIYIIAIPFKFFPSSETLMIVNYLIMISAGIPLYKLSYHLKNDRMLSTVFVICLFWYTTFQYITLYEFEMLRLSIPIIFWALYFYEVKNFKFYFISITLAILVREEVALTIFMLGVYLLFFRENKKIGFFTALVGFSSFFIITQSIMPALRGVEYEHIAMGSFENIGKSETDIIKNIFYNPLLIIKAVFNDEFIIKLANLFMYFLPLLFIPLLSLRTLMPILAPFGIGFLSGHITHSSFMLYYCSSAVPFIFYSLIKGWDKYIHIFNSIFTKLFKKEDRNQNLLAMWGLLICVFSTNFIFGSSPISIQFWNKEIRPAPFNNQNHHFSAYVVSNHHRLVDEVVELIPDSAIVACPGFLFPRVFKKKSAVYLDNKDQSFIPLLVKNDKSKVVDYIFFDKKNDNLSMPRFKDVNNRIISFIFNDSQNWELIINLDGYHLYKRII